MKTFILISSLIVFSLQGCKEKAVIKTPVQNHVITTPVMTIDVHSYKNMDSKKNGTSYVNYLTHKDTDC